MDIIHYSLNDTVLDVFIDDQSIDFLDLVTINIKDILLIESYKITHEIDTPHLLGDVTLYRNSRYIGQIKFSIILKTLSGNIRLFFEYDNTFHNYDDTLILRKIDDDLFEELKNKSNEKFLKVIDMYSKVKEEWKKHIGTKTLSFSM